MLHATNEVKRENVTYTSVFWRDDYPQLLSLGEGRVCVGDSRSAVIHFRSLDHLEQWLGTIQLQVSDARQVGEDV